MSDYSEMPAGDEILQVDTLKPDAEPRKDPRDVSRGGLKRTTAGQERRISAPPGGQENAGEEGQEAPPGEQPDEQVA